MMFKIIVADPPWSFGDKLSKMKDQTQRGADSHYSTLDLPAILALPVAQIADDAALLGLWVPSSMLRDGLDVMSAWGFEQKQVWTWVKQSKSGKMACGMGRLARNATENMLVGVRGRIYADLADRSTRNVFHAPNEGHSRKPDIVQDALDRMFPTGRRLEMFARRDRPGWTCVGNEAPGTRGEDIRGSLERLLGEGA